MRRRRTQLAALYCPDNGRPAEEPVPLLGVLILQYMERLPDRQAAEACTYDLRWKLARGMEADETAFHPMGLVYFRRQLLERCPRPTIRRGRRPTRSSRRWSPSRRSPATRRRCRSSSRSGRARITRGLGTPTEGAEPPALRAGMGRLRPYVRVLPMIKTPQPTDLSFRQALPSSFSLLTLTLDPPIQPDLAKKVNI